MKLELRKDHKDKLLEMCKQFFSDYNDIDFSDGPIGMMFFEKIDFESEFYCVFDIHWFEFCMNELPRKIFSPQINKYGQGHLDFHRAKMLRYFEHKDDPEIYPHPVDYLYAAVKNGKHKL